MRNYIRHLASIPIHISVGENLSTAVKVQNLSVGGLSFVTDEKVKVGDFIDFQIPVVKPDYHGQGVVVWRRQQALDVFEIGLRFTNDDEFFRTRMVEQVCRIESYRQTLYEKGRNLTSEEAALEWIEKFAGDFGEEE